MEKNPYNPITEPEMKKATLEPMGHYPEPNKLMEAVNLTHQQAIQRKEAELSELQEKYNTLASHFEFALTQLYHDPKKVQQRLIEAGLKEQ